MSTSETDTFVTLPLARHFEEYLELLAFVGFVHGAASSYDRLAIEKAAPIPEPTTADGEAFFEGMMRNISELRSRQDNKQLASQKLQAFEQIQCQMLFSRVVDNFLVYLSDLTALVYQAQPNLLKTEAPVTAEFVLQHATIEDFVSALAERRVSQLSREGVRPLAQKLSKQWGLTLFPEEKVLKSISNIVEIRNLIVHNRGIVDRAFIDKVETLSDEPFPYKVGEQFELVVGTVTNVLTRLSACAFGMDKLVAEKFGLAVAVLPKPKGGFQFFPEDTKDIGQTINDALLPTEE